jgi:putative ABC transport system substrate-binding protein
MLLSRHTRRRSFIMGLGGTAAWPLMARAQRPDGMRLIGVLMGVESGPDQRARITAFRKGLQESGWADDRNLRIDVIWGPGDAQHVKADAAELVRKSPDVILANGPIPTLGIAKDDAQHTHRVCAGA